jgi:hypothetical protein
MEILRLSYIFSSTVYKKHFGLIFVCGITKGEISSSLNCTTELRSCPSIPHEGIWKKEVHFNFYDLNNYPFLTSIIQLF